ncbi:MAG TPA: hypothetical protein VGC18_11650 [Lacisediminihabitans sp.]|uniref:hypothetical protein n=1 Tax=Lacisediminihabitans sp. TaxID=2787631 RepID=UPI002EDA0560
MISRSIALELQQSGVRWSPASGDAFVINREGFEGDVFVVSDMTIESHEFETGTILGFNGTTEWALDSVALEQALWLPHEHQLRELLRGAFRSLTRTGSGFRVEFVVAGRDTFVEEADASDAYATAVLALVRAAV